MARIEIEADGGMVDVMLGDMGVHNNPTSGIDAKKDVPRLFEVVVSTQRVIDAAIGTESAHCVFVAREAMTLIAARFIPDAAVTAHDTNYATLALTTNAGTPVALTEDMDTTITGGTGNWVAETAEEFTVVASADIDAGEGILLDIDKAADGLKVPGGRLQLELRHR